MPPAKHVMVYGVPGTEGNAVEVARALTVASDVVVAWPEAPSVGYLEGLGIDASRIIRLPPTRSMRTVWTFLRARAVFCTHGMYGNPTPSHRHIIVNVWHGDGFKGGALFPSRTLRGPSSTFLVSSSDAIGTIKTRLAKVPLSSLLVVGNPRVAQMFKPASSAQLKALGIEPNIPFVLWMPTFRIAQDGQGAVAFSNTANPDADRALATVAEKVAARLRLAGFNLVVKPHRLDATSRSVAGAAIVDDGVLAESGTPLYSLIGASAGLISDYSSVWIDYLVVNRPIGFLIDDIEDFRREREVTMPELIDVYPGERLDSDNGITRFVQDLETDGELDSGRREAFKTKIGFVGSLSSGEDLVRKVLGRS